MAEKIVELPDGQRWAFPGKMTDEEIGKIIQQQYPPKTQAQGPAMPAQAIPMNPMASQFAESPIGQTMPSTEAPPPAPLNLRALGDLGLSAGAGMAAGALSRLIPGGAAVSPLVQAGTQYGAKKASEALGLSQQGPALVGPLSGGDIAAMAIPGAMEAGRAMAPALARRLPGAAGAMHEEAAMRAVEMPKIIDIPLPSDRLFDQVAMAGRGAAPIPAPALGKEAERIIARQTARGAGAEIPGLRTIAQGIVDDLGATGGTLDLMQVAEKLKAYGKLSGVLQDRTGEATGYGKALFKALSNDLDSAVTQKGVSSTEIEMLLAARNLFRREAARYDLAETIGKSIATKNPQLSEVEPGVKTLAGLNRADEATRVDVRKIENFVKTNDFFRESITPAEVDELEAYLKRMRGLPALPPPRGVYYGAGRASLGAGLAGGAMGIAQSLGIAPQSPYLTSAAAFAGAAAPQILSNALMTPTGRRLLMRVMQPGGLLTPEAMGLLAGSMAAEARGSAP